MGEDWRFGEKAVISPILTRYQTYTSGLVGTDINAKGLARIDGRNIPLFVGADALHLPFQDKTFDVLVAGEILEHLSNAGSFLDETWRILSPSGIFVGTVPNACHGVVHVLKGDTSPASKNSTHVHLFDDWTISLMLLQHNLLISNIAWLFSAFSPINKFTTSFKRRLFPRTAYGIGFIAKKITKSQSTKIMDSFSDELREKRVEWANRPRLFSKQRGQTSYPKL